MVKKGKKGHKYIFTVIVVIVVVAAVIASYKTGLIKFAPTDTKEKNIVAAVNEEDITQEQLDKQYELFFTLVGYPESFRGQITKAVYLNQMIVEILMLQEAEKLGISPLLVGSKELKSSLDAYLDTNGITTQELAENLVSKSLTTEDLGGYFKKQIAINNFLNRTLLSKIEVTEEDVDTFKEGKIMARHILVETEEEADEIISKLRAGADFAELAKEYSLDTVSGVRGGDLGFFSKDMMVQEFGEAAFDLTINKISKPVQTQFGWHVIQRQNDNVLFGEIKDSLSAQLYQEKQRDVLQTYLEQLKSEADIEEKPIE